MLSIAANRSPPSFGRNWARTQRGHHASMIRTASAWS